MSAISVADLSHLRESAADRLRELFDVENWPDPLDDGLDHAPGEARLITSSVGRGERQTATVEEIDEFFEHGGIEDAGGADWPPKHRGDRD